MNTIFRNIKTVSSPAGFFLSPGSTYLQRILPALMVLALGFVLAAGWGIGMDRAYANSVERWVSQDADDAEEDDGGDIDLTSSDLELVEESTVQQVGMRFQNIDIPQGATINSAYIEFACDETGPTVATSLIFRGQAHNNAVEFSGTLYDISHRATTGASVSWNISAQWAVAHEKHRSPDLSSIIQEIVNRSGWNKKNALVIIVTGSGKRVAESWNGANGSGDLTLAPKLFIDYDSGGGGTGCEITFRDKKLAMSTSTTSLSVDKPSTEEGDLLIATVAFGNGSAVLSAPAGWTKIQPSSPGSEMLRTHAWYKEVEAGEPGSYLFSASGSADEMLVQIASFKSSAGAFVLKWNLKDSSYNYLGSASTVINSDKVTCVDDGLLYFAGSYDDAADVASRPSSMTVLSEQKTTSGSDPHLSLATYYELRDAGNNITKTIEWTSPEAFLTAIAAVFSCQSTELWTITASSGLNGSISPIGDVVVPEGGSETFAILPDSGYQVADVVVDGDSKGALSSYTFNNVKKDHTIAAFFAASSLYVITTSPGSNGRISPSGPVGVAPGADQTFTIIPDAGYVVDKVEVDGKKKGALTSYTFENVDDHHNISATFKVDTAAPPVADCVDISDIPLEARFQSAAPNIMIALDDSGSMSYEILVPGAIDGRYEDWFDYVFDNPCGKVFGPPECHEYDRDSILVRGGNRLHWKTQWAEFNKLYYDPQMDYEPWATATGRMDNADADNPRVHAMYPSPTFDLSSSYDRIAADSFEIIADDANTAVFTKTGPWTEMTGYGSHNNHYYAARDKASYTAVWTPYVPGGTYKVYAWWTDPLNDRSHNVPYTIVHAGGTSTVYRDQSSNEANWVELGIFSFNSGIAQVSISVTLSKADENTVCADAIKFVPEGTLNIDIPRAHYYVKSATENKPYLVVLENGFIGYYEFNDDDHDDVVDAGELMPSLNPPSDVKSGRSYVQERQNFANWYTYYRRRSYTATYATAELITGMQAVRIGIYGINAAIGKSWSISQPVLNIKNDDEDYTETLLNLLYGAEFQGGTPLRRALEAGGSYFDKHDNKKLDGTAGDDSPWASAADGGECQQAFTILITDGYYNGNNPSGTIQNVDGNNGVPYADTYSRTLADVAMYYYERDLNTDLADNVPVNSSDDATHQHMVTYSVGFGVIGALSPDDYDADLRHKTTGNYIVWTDPGKTGQVPEKVDDLWHAAVNARGKFLNSSNPRQLVNALKSVLLDIERRVFSSSGVAINGDELYQRIHPDLLMFQASYSSEGWTGALKAYKVDPVTGEVDVMDPEWSAAELLQSKSWDTGRLIATYDGTAGIPFRYDRLTDTQKGQLDENWGTDPTLALNLVKYLRGDTANEVKNGGTLRNRFYVLGDIVHSSPVFKNDILYAGGNDGMLHAFAAETGEELFTYVPNLVFENLKDLADPNYVHRFYVDLTPTVKDVGLSGVSTMLVGGLGKGGRGYYALDLTGLSPTTIPATEDLLDNQVMWEYPNAATPGVQTADLGYSYSKVALVQSNDSAGAPWVVIFGNGYGSPNGHAVLFMLNPETGALIKRIDTLVGDCNGLSTPVAVDVDYNDTVDYVYAGDLKGNLWKFDLTADDYTQWDVAYKEAGIPIPLFKTPNQPITTKPNVMYHCQKEGYIVNFGTGKYLGLEDVTNTSVQAVYGIWDYGDDADDGEYVGAFNGSTITNPNLPGTVSLLQQIVVDERTENGLDLRTLSDGHPDWASTTVDGSCGDNSGTEDCDPNAVGSDPDPVRNVGWYFNLPESGERVVSELRIRGGNLTVISYVGEGSTCGLAGHSWVMVMDACSGARLSEAHFDINGDGVIDEHDLINIGTVADPIYVVPTGVKYDGKLEPPAYLIISNETEKLYLNSSEAEIETLLEKTPRLGMTYWRVLRR